jgi:hypothetical protein
MAKGGRGAVDDPLERLHNIDSEVLIGLVGALGTDLARIRDLVTEAFVRVRYDVIIRKMERATPVKRRLGNRKRLGHGFSCCNRPTLTWNSKQQICLVKNPQIRGSVGWTRR